MLVYNLSYKSVKSRHFLKVMEKKKEKKFHFTSGAFQSWRLNEFSITVADDAAISAPLAAGVNAIPREGRRTPAARGSAHAL